MEPGESASHITPIYPVALAGAIRAVAALAGSKERGSGKPRAVRGKHSITMTAGEKQKAADVLAPHWNKVQRHDQTLNLAGAMLRQGIGVDDIREVVTLICEAAPDEELSDRLKAVSDTHANFLSSDEKITGVPALRTGFEEAVVDEFLRCLPDDRNPTRKPELFVSDRSLDDVLTECGEHLVSTNDPPAVFVWNSQLAVVDGGPKPVLRALTVNAAKAVIARKIHVTVSARNEDIVPAFPSSDWVSALLESPIYFEQLPALDMMVETPLFSPEGVLLTTQGYHPKTRTYLPNDQFEHILPDEEVTREEAVEAILWFREHPLHGFPFADEASFTHAMSFLWQHFLQFIINGPRPLGLIEATAPGSGKGLLADVIMRISTPSPFITGFPRDNEEEVRKKIMSALRSGKAHYLLDNLEGRIESEHLCIMLTAYPEYSDRILGSSTIETAPNRGTWLATANNARLSTDITTRSVLIRLDPDCEDPTKRTGFKIENLAEWVAEHRLECVEKALIPLRYWVQQGMKPYQGEQTHRMKAWVSVMGGICEAVGMKGFLTNTDDLRTGANDEGAMWGQFVLAWAGAWQDKEVGAKDLVGIAFGHEDEEGGGPLSEKCRATTFGGKRTTLGMLLASKRDRIFAGHKIKVLPDTRNGHKYHLVKKP